ncbi:hypothetical protein DPMN_004947 [Dreissena polymorpha]|uniref:Uncharacterized protein n=1 Tax=Dreissena polymorpha TaxID=45954 RepID=A0A9D4RU00_DREPO|nr:hypothetical protein DPMN_004947 [Dreissena polymorpha]
MVNQASSHRDSNFSLGTDRMSDERPLTSEIHRHLAVPSGAWATSGTAAALPSSPTE